MRALVKKINGIFIGLILIPVYLLGVGAARIIYHLTYRKPKLLKKDHSYWEKPGRQIVDFTSPY